MAKKLFTQHPYNSDIWLCNTRKEWESLVLRNEVGVPLCLSEDCKGVTTFSGNRGVIIIAVFDGGVEEIAHECYHAVMILSEKYGLPLGGADSEPNAYLIGKLVLSMCKMLGIK